MLSALLLGSALTFALVLSRIAGLVVSSPFPGQVGRTTKVGLVLVLTWVVAPTVAPSARIAGALGAGLPAPTLAVLVGQEILFGMLMGFVFRTIVLAGDVFGTIASNTIGFSTASLFDPNTQESETALGRAVSMMTIMVALALGVHRMVIMAMVSSFRAMPVGTSFDFSAAMPELIVLGRETLSLGLQLAMPMLGVALVMQVTLAMISRAAPSLQLFSIGLSLLAISGLWVLGDVLPDVIRGLGANLLRTTDWIGRVADAVTRR